MILWKNFVCKILDGLRPFSMFQKIIRRQDNGLMIDGVCYNLDNFSSLRLIGIGKASSLQLVDCIRHLNNLGFDDRIQSAFSLTKLGYGLQQMGLDEIESSHPYPDEMTLVATKRLIDHLDQTMPHDLCIFFISGGASALILSPIEGLALVDAIQLNRILVTSFASIEEINLVRKAFCKLKNGGLLSHLMGRTVINLILSDIPEGGISMVGSSPSYHFDLDEKKLKDILFKYIGDKKLLEQLISIVNSGCVRELEKRRLQASAKVETQNVLLADFSDLMTQTRSVVRQEFPQIQFFEYSSVMSGPFSDILDWHLKFIENKFKESFVLVSFGEASIELPSNAGVGGRNMHFVAAMAQALFVENRWGLSNEILHRIHILSVGTDGTDGPTDYAGAYLSYNDWNMAVRNGIDLTHYLTTYNTLAYFQAIDTLIVLGATGTNLMDLRLICYL